MVAILGGSVPWFPPYTQPPLPEFRRKKLPFFPPSLNLQFLMRSRCAVAMKGKTLASVYVECGFRDGYVPFVLLKVCWTETH